jgi:hypothetical protein
MAFEDTALFVGNEIVHASAFDIAALTFGVSMLLAFVQGYIVWQGEKLPAEGFLENIKAVMPLLLEAVGDLSRRLQKREYGDTQATLDAYSIRPKELASWCEDRGVDHSIADAYRGLMDRAIKAGQGQADFAYLYEVLKDGHVSAAVSHQATA